MASREILVRLRAEIGNFRQNMGQAAAAARGAGDAAEEAGAQSQRGVAGLLATAEANAEVWDKVGKGMMVVGGAIVAAVGVSIAKFASFDKAMSSVDAATHETAANMELLREKAIQVGADTAFSAEEAAQGIEELAKAGVSTKDILGGGLAGSMDLAAAGALAVGDAAEIAASAIVQFGLDGSTVPHIADLLAAGAGKAQGSVADMGLALSYAGVPAKGLGVSIEETTGMIALFASNGIVGEKAGTALRSMFVSLQNPSKKAANAMEDLGIDVFDASGEFIGMQGVAGVLSDRLGDLTVEQRGSALATIFGSEALGAATAVYEGGASKVKEWTDNVNDAGYAAETAARMQDNLAGDIEKLGGAFDTLLIKSGTGPAEILRDIVQAAEGAVDAVGKVPAPLLTSITVAAALVGGLLLLGGAFITVVPKIAATRAAISAFNTASPAMVGAMKKIGIAAGVAGLAIIGMGAAASKVSRVGAVDVDQMTASMIGLSKAGTNVNDLITGDSFLLANDMHDTKEQITGIGDALHRVSNISAGEGAMGAWTDITNLLGGKASTQIQETEKAISGMSDALAGMVGNGLQEEAAVAFSKIATEAEKSDVAVGVVTERFNSYEMALRKQAKTLGVVLTDEEYYQWMLGKTPPLIDAAASSAEGQTAAAEAMSAANEETAQRLADVGLSADGTVASLGKLLEAMFATGLIQLSANEASIKWQESIEGLDASLIKYGQNLDITTEGGKANSRALDGMAQAGISNMEAMANNGATQESLQATLGTTYESVKRAAEGFGMGTEEADAYARGVLGIPEGADVNIAIQNYAEEMAKLNGIKTELEGLDGKTANVWVTTHNNSIYSEEHVSNGPGGRGGQTAGGYTGGLVGSLIGGLVPGRIPLNSHGDNILASVNGKPFGLRSGEMVINEQASRANMPLLESINDGTYQPPSKSMAAGYAPQMSRSASSGGGGVTVQINIGDLLAADLPGIKREVIDAIDKKYRNAGVTA